MEAYSMEAAKIENPPVQSGELSAADNPAERLGESAEMETPEVLTVEDEMAEFMFLGLRMLSGISTQEFQERFGCPIDEVYGEVIRKMSSLHLLERREDHMLLTPRGLDVSNQVMAEFLL